MIELFFWGITDEIHVGKTSTSLTSIGSCGEDRNDSGSWQVNASIHQFLVRMNAMQIPCCINLVVLYINTTIFIFIDSVNLCKSIVICPSNSNLMHMNVREFSLFFFLHKRVSRFQKFSDINFFFNLIPITIFLIRCYSILVIPKK